MTQCIERSRSTWRRNLLLALLGILRDFACVKVGWPHQRPALHRKPRRSDVHRAFVERAQEVADDLDQLSGVEDASLYCADARLSSSWRLALHREAARALLA